MTATELSPVRIGRITASRVPKILGLSPHGGPDDVLREMVREYFGDETEFKGNFITEYGTQHEPDAIAEYEMVRGVVVNAAGDWQDTIVHPTLDFLAATPDGLVGDEGVVETKAPWRAIYSHVSQRPDIEAQMRLQIECTQREWCDLAVWRPEGLAPPSRVMDDAKWLPSKLGQLEDFMATFLAVIEDEKRSAPYRSPLVNQRTDPDWAAAAYNYLECLAVKEAAERSVDEAKAELVRLAGEERSTRGNGVLLTRSVPSPAVSYKKALEKYAPDADLSAFTTGGGGTPTWTARKSK